MNSGMNEKLFAALQKIIISPGQKFIKRPAASMGRLVSQERFLSGKNVVITASPPMYLQLNLPDTLNLPLEDIKIQRPIGMPLNMPGFPSSIDVPAMTIARLSNVICLSGGVLLSYPDIVLEETFSAPWECVYHHHLIKDENEKYSVIREYNTNIFLKGKYLCLDYQHFFHYGHFLLDVLSRIWAYDYLTSFFGIDDLRILMPAMEASFANEFLDLYGISSDRIVPLEGAVTVEELFVPTKSFQIQEYTSPTAVATWKKISNAERGVGGPKRIYVSRSRNPQRILVNERETEEIVRAKGFIVIHPEEIPVRRQVGLFANAEIVVGTSGSNMFNLAFQRRLRAALILASPLLVHYTDVFLQCGNKSHLTYFVGEPAIDHPNFDDQNVHSPWHIDLASFSRALDEWLAIHDPQ